MVNINGVDVNMSNWEELIYELYEEYKITIEEYWNLVENL